MNSKQKGKLSRILVRGALFGLTCLGGVVLGVYLARIQIAHFLAENALTEAGIDEARFEWDRLDSEMSSLSDIFIKSDSYALNVKQLELSYNLTDAWKEKELKTLKLKGVELYYDLTGPSTVDLQEIDTLIKDGIPFPLQSVTIEDATVILLTDLGETKFDLHLALSQAGGSGIRGEAKAATETESISLDLSISDRIRGSIQATVLDLESTLAANGIEWKGALPFSQEDAIQLTSASIDTDIVFHGITLESASVSANLGPLFIRDFDLEADIKNVQTSLDLLGNEVRNIESNIFLGSLSYDQLFVSDTQLQLSSLDLSDFLIKVPDTQWESTNGENGVFSIVATPVLNDDYSIESYSGELTFSELQSDSFNLAPFDIAFKGDLESATASLGNLVTQTMPWLVIENLETTIVGLTTESPQIEASAAIVSKELPSSHQKPPLTGRWNLQASLSHGLDTQKASVTITPEGETRIASLPFATLYGTALLRADLDYWPTDNQAALALNLTAADLATDFNDWALQGATASLSLSTEPVDLLLLGKHINNTPALIEYAAPLTKYEFNLQGSELNGPSDLVVQWFSAGIRSLDRLPSSPIHSRLELGAGIVQLGTETVNQFSLDSEIKGSYNFLETNTSATLLLENEPVSISLEQSVESVTKEFVSKGKYEIKGIHLVSSDILARHLPALKDSSVSAKIALNGETQAKGKSWDASMHIQLREGGLRLPSQELTVDSVRTDVNFPSLLSLTTSPSQTIAADRITIGDIEATQVESAFMIADGSQLSVEKAGLSIFEGRVTLDPFTISTTDPNADLLIHFNRLSITPAITMLDFFDGYVSGRLNGTLPIRIENGYPVLGEGYLELDPSEPAQFSYNATGFFTDQGSDQLAKKTLGDKLLERLELEPNALLEDALGSLTIQKLRLDLFNKNLPNTPMRIQLEGTADTGNTQIPLNITTNINGTVAELLNFLTRLDSLGLIADQEPNP